MDPCTAASWFCSIRQYVPDPALILVTILLAGVTWRLVRRTQDLAKDTIAAAYHVDRAHQEQLMPICHFIGELRMVFVGKDASGNTIESLDRTKMDGFTHERTHYQLVGAIKNDGPGTAISVSLNFATARSEGSITYAAGAGFGVIAPGSEVPVNSAYLVWEAGQSSETMLNGFLFQIFAHNIFQQNALTLHTGAFMNGTSVDVSRAPFAFEPPKSVDRVFLASEGRSKGIIAKLVDRMRQLSPSSKSEK